MHRHSAPRLPHLQTPRAPSAEEAVTNILYNTPAPSTEPYKRHLLNCLVQNEPGVLSRVSGILAGRGFNIDSLVVCQTEIRDLSRMCIVLKGQDGVVEQARRQLEDLVCLSTRLCLVLSTGVSPDDSGDKRIRRCSTPTISHPTSRTGGLIHRFPSGPCSTTRPPASSSANSSSPKSPSSGPSSHKSSYSVLPLTKPLTRPSWIKTRGTASSPSPLPRANKLPPKTPTSRHGNKPWPGRLKPRGATPSLPRAARGDHRPPCTPTGSQA